MKLAFCLFKYFPFGGLARDFYRIMTLCRDRGHSIDIYTMKWQGEAPAGVNVEVYATNGWTNHGKASKFINKVIPQLKNGDYDLILGFNKMPRLDLYFAADPCYLERVKNKKSYFINRHSGRQKFYSQCELAVFGPKSKTVSLLISDIQKQDFQKHYNTPERRLVMLPPGIDASRKRPDNWKEQREQFRRQFNINENELIILMIGTGFKTKGVDRSIKSLASLPDNLLKKSHLFIVGEGDTKIYQDIIEKLNIEKRVRFFGGRNDIPEFLLGADLLLHPARVENTGTVILEALVAGLPVLVTEVCGYAKHVKKSTAGLVIPSPFDQTTLNNKLAQMLQDVQLSTWSENGLSYAENEDLYSMPQKVLQIIEQTIKFKK